MLRMIEHQMQKADHSPECMMGNSQEQENAVRNGCDAPIHMLTLHLLRISECHECSGCFAFCSGL